MANSSARQPPGCSHESTGPLSERNRRLGWGASRRRKRSIRPLGFDRPPHSDLSIDNNSPVGAPRRLKKRTKLPPAWIGRARNVARFETWLAQQSSHNELTITWRVPPRLGGTLPKVGRHAQLIPADSGGRSDRPLTSAVRLIHRRRLSCREANVEGDAKTASFEPARPPGICYFPVQRTEYSPTGGCRGYGLNEDKEDDNCNLPSVLGCR